MLVVAVLGLGLGRIATLMAQPLSAREDGQRGFSLLEVLVALVIAGIAFSVLVRVAAEGARSAAVASRYQDAVSRARSHLDRISADLSPGEQEGDDGGGYRWRVWTRASGSTGKQDLAGQQVPGNDAVVVTLYATTVWITWRDGATDRAVRLDSARLLTSSPG